MEKILLGDCVASTEVLSADEVIQDMTSLKNQLSGIVLNSEDDDVDKLYDIVGQIIVKFGGTYETLSKHANSYDMQEQLDAITSNADDDVKALIVEKQEELKAKNPDTKENSEDMAAVALTILAEHYGVDVAEVLGDGKTEPRTEDDEFKLQNAIYSKQLAK